MRHRACEEDLLWSARQSTRSPDRRLRNASRNGSIDQSLDSIWACFHAPGKCTRSLHAPSREVSTCRLTRGRITTRLRYTTNSVSTSDATSCMPWFALAGLIVNQIARLQVVTYLSRWLAVWSSQHAHADYRDGRNRDRRRPGSRRLPERWVRRAQPISWAGLGSKPARRSPPALDGLGARDHIRR